MYVLESKISTLPNYVYICNDKVKNRIMNSNYDISNENLYRPNYIEIMLSKLNL